MKTAKDWDRAELPLLSIRIRNRPRPDKSPLQIRMIKVRMDGPRAGRWINYANWWWQNNRGPIPPGKRVAHLDGDSLNDDPSNLDCLTPGDIAFLCHERDPEMSAKNLAAMRKGTAQFNRDIAAIRRETDWLNDRWYLVDLERKQIVNQPTRERWQALRLAGLPIDSTNWRHGASVSLGWPTLNIRCACALAALAEQPSLSRCELSKRVEAIRQIRGWHPARLTSGAMSSTLAALGSLVVRSGRGNRAHYWITQAALKMRTASTTLIALRGSELHAPAFIDFTRIANVPQTSIQAGMFPARGEGAAVSCDDLDCRPHRFTDLQPSHRRVLTPGLRPAGPFKATPSRVRQRVLNSNRAQDASPVKSSLISPPAEPARARSAMAGGAGIGVAGSPGASALISDQPGRGAK